VQTPITVDDVDRMTGTLFISQGADRSRKTTAFWTLLVAAAVIATAGVVADSTATVIGAMIVAPLMTPILGTAVAVVLADKRAVTANLGIVVAGAALVVAVGFAIGTLDPFPIVADTNSQVAGRVSPGLIDLLAALATGAVGAFALVRSDVSDTLPGVAIAISLVPPLAVVGLTLESGAGDEARGALLLFGTNVAAIIATGTVVLLLYRVRQVATAAGRPVGVLRGRTLAAVALSVLVVAVPLALGTRQVLVEQATVARASGAAAEWAVAEGWVIRDVSMLQDVLSVVAIGPPPEADVAELRAMLDSAGLEGVDVDITLVVGGSRLLPADG
jgi:uncharacterized hydrophobic protein (TIGR00271 family)